MRTLALIYLSAALLISGCASTPTTPASALESAKAMTPDNPFAAPSTLYMQMPAFDKIDNAHYAPAFVQGMSDHLVEIDAIANDPTPATFANTMVPLEKSGQLLNRVSIVFYALASADTNDTIESLRAELAPKMSAHFDNIFLNEKLFGRVKALHDTRADAGYDAESLRLVEETYKQFVRAGALLDEAQKETLRGMNAEIASLQTQFSQNVLNEVNAKAIVVED
ncbi:MAG: dipeptidyl carboxypeptidase II, partial [Gammaproteobacteria bacterium]|nr:dipeptidyl carboxypeptidase II [Gammaproteobacteria bacterium]